MTDWYWYEQIDEESVRILRIFGTSPEVIVPGQIAGKVVTELGAYCFAEKNQAVSYQVCSEEQAGEQAEKEFQELLEKSSFGNWQEDIYRRSRFRKVLNGLEISAFISVAG